MGTNVVYREESYRTREACLEADKASSGLAFVYFVYFVYFVVYFFPPCLIN